MYPRRVLEKAKSEHFSWVDYYADDTPFDASEENDEPQTLKLREPLTDIQIGVFEKKLPKALPPEIRELLLFASGFDIGGDEVAFDQYNQWGYEFLLPHVAVLAGDGRGNSWVIEVDSETGAWRHVWFECHDPAVLIYQCETLAEFIDAVLDKSRLAKAQAGHRSILQDVDERAGELWRKNSRFPKASDLTKSNDPVLARFAASLDPDTRVADFRKPSRGDGFDWSALNAGPTAVKREGTQLVFGIQPRKGLLRRLFAK